MKKLCLSFRLLVLLFFCSFVLLSSIAAPASAQDSLPNPLGVTDVPTLIGRVIQGVLGVVGSIALLMFIYGGFTWLTAAGNEKNVEKGKNILTWAVIGLAIIFSSYVLVNFVIGGLTSGGAT